MNAQQPVPGERERGLGPEREAFDTGNALLPNGMPWNFILRQLPAAYRSPKAHINHVYVYIEPNT